MVKHKSCKTIHCYINRQNSKLYDFNSELEVWQIFNMDARKLSDIQLCSWACGPQILGIHNRQISCDHVTTITCITVANLPRRYNIAVGGPWPQLSQLSEKLCALYCLYCNLPVNSYTFFSSHPWIIATGHTTITAICHPWINLTVYIHIISAMYIADFHWLDSIRICLCDTF